MRIRHARKKPIGLIVLLCALIVAMITLGVIVVINLNNSAPEEETNDNVSENNTLLDDTIDAATVAYDQIYSSSENVDAAIVAFKKFEAKLSTSEEKASFYMTLTNHVAYTCGTECSAQILAAVYQALELNQNNETLFGACQMESIYGDVTKSKVACEKYNQSVVNVPDYIDQEQPSLQK